MGLQALQKASYLSFGTYRKSGESVDTPVWFAEEGGTYYIFSAGEAGKIKRLRNSGRSRIAACTVTGVLQGDWVDCEAHILDADEESVALDALRRKYGLMMRMTDLGSKLTGKFKQRAYIAVSPITS